MTSFEEKRRTALAKAQTLAKPSVQAEGDAESGVPSGSNAEPFELSKVEENVMVKPSSFNMRPVYSKVDINNDKWLMTMTPESRLKLETPPSIVDGLDPFIEQELRLLGCELIQEGAILLKLPQTAAATGQILFQRFYYQRSFVKYMFQHTVMACLLLASKIEEAPRRPRDIYNVFHKLEQLHNLRNKGHEINTETTARLKPRLLDSNYQNAKNHVIKTERRILACLGFVVHVKHPHKLIVSYIHTLGQTHRWDFMQKAWSYMNDGLRTDMFVRYKPETIACACIFLAARTIEDPIPLPSTPFHWFELFDASDRDVQAISFQLLALYNRTRPVNMHRLVVILDKMREEKELAEKAKQAAIIAAKLMENAVKDEKSEDNEASEKKQKSRSRSPSRSRSRSPRRKSPKRRRDSPDRKYRGPQRDRRDDRDRRDRVRDDKRRRSRSRDRGNRGRDYDRKDRGKLRGEFVYEELKIRREVAPLKPRK